MRVRPDCHSSREDGTCGLLGGNCVLTCNIRDKRPEKNREAA